MNAGKLCAYLTAKYPSKVQIVRYNEDGSISYDFDPSATDAEKQAITADGASYVPPADPNPVAAKEAIFSDATIPASALVQLIAYKGLLDDYPQSPAVVQQAWRLLIAEFGSTWLTADVQTAIQNHAAANGCPLV